MRPIAGRRSDGRRILTWNVASQNWDSIAVLTLMTKSCHGFKAASQQNRFGARFFLRRHSGGAESAAMGGNSGRGLARNFLLHLACISLAGDEIDRLSLETMAPLLFYFADREAPQARGHA
jgi:hypothetical protein